MALSYIDGSYWFDNDPNALLSAVNNTAVISGLTVTQTGAGANQAVDVAAGVYLVGGTRVVYAGGNIAAPAADVNNPRKDILVADNAGALTFTQGTAASALPTGEIGVRTYQPVPPNIPAARIILAEIYRAANDNTIANADITEKFIIVPSRMIGRELLTAQGQIIYASAAQTPTVLAPGTSGYFLKTQGAGANPIWAAPLVDFQRFTASDTWTKPAGAKIVIVECFGAGGGGGGGIATLGGNSRAGGGGGGGGTRAFRVLPAASLGATETVTIGAGGTGGASNTDGVAGGASSFGSHLTAYGGGFGNGDATPGQVNGGGGGAGAYAVGANGGVATGGAGGGPGGAAAGASVDGFGGGGGGNATVGGASVYGGGGGGSSTAVAFPVYAGGCSVHAGGGGGSGGGCASDDSELAGAAGGGVPGATSGGGGAGGAENGGAGAAGTASGEYAGSGGGGGGGQDSGTGGVGGAGGAPGGGGGGGGGASPTGGVGGAGARGEVRVWAG